MAGSDYIFWLITHPFASVAQRMFIPAYYELTPEKEEKMEDIIKSIIPIQPRREGLIFDIFISNTDPNKNKALYNLEEITTPTLFDKKLKEKFQLLTQEVPPVFG